MKRTKLLINGFIGNKEISSVITPEESVTEEYIEKGLNNPYLWKLSKVTNGWIITEKWDEETKKWKQTSTSEIPLKKKG